MSTDTPAEGRTATTGTVRPFRVEIPEEALEDLRRRVAGVRWPSRELVADRSQGVQLATLQALAGYWANDYDLGRVQARLNTLAQFRTEIDGVDLHFLHLRSPHAEALPLVMTHGWPGSVIELLETIGPLTDPPPTAAPPPTPLTWCCRRCPATASRPSPPRSAGTPAGSPARGRC